jgi:polysaccharide chain length determinant protein (PEP-CTERM system associated)
MKEQIAQILMRTRGALRYRYYALGVAWAAAVVGWLVVLAQPNVYEVWTRIYIDTNSVLKPLLNGLTVSTDVSSRISMMSRAMMGRPNLERVARETKLNARARNSEDLARVVTLLGQQIKVEGGGSDNVYTLRYNDSDPKMAQRVVNTLLTSFLEDTLGLKRVEDATAQQFLQAQVRDYEKRLRDAEERLATFKQLNVGLLPGETGDYYTRLQTALIQLQEVRAKYRLAADRRIELSKQLEGENPTFGIFTGGDTTGSTDGRVIEYRRELDQLLLQYTDKHPRVIALRETIAQLEAQNAAKASRTKGATKYQLAVPRDKGDAAALALDINPVYQNLRIELSRTEVERAELQQEVADKEATVADLNGKVNTIPEIEAQLTRLNREYEVNRAQYQALLQRLESAHLSQQADASDATRRFRIIDPPIVPSGPVGPKRALFISIVLLASLALGAAVALLLNELHPVFISRASLATVTGLTVLGSVGVLRSKPAQPLLLQTPVMLASSAGALVVLYALVVANANSMSRIMLMVVD